MSRNNKKNRRDKGKPGGEPKKSKLPSVAPSQPVILPTVETECVASAPLESQLLRDARTLEADLRLVKRAVSRGWNVRQKSSVRRRLLEIMSKETGQVVAGDGFILNLETKGDEMAIAAAKVLIEMDKADQKRLGKPEEKPVPTATATAITVNVNVDNRKSELAELARSLGVETLLISGREIPTSDIIGTATPIPTKVRGGEQHQMVDRPAAVEAPPEAT